MSRERERFFDIPGDETGAHFPDPAEDSREVMPVDLDTFIRYLTSEQRLSIAEVQQKVSSAGYNVSTTEVESIFHRITSPSAFPGGGVSDQGIDTASSEEQPQFLHFDFLVASAIAAFDSEFTHREIVKTLGEAGYDTTIPEIARSISRMRRLARQTEPDEVPEEITFPEKDKNGEDLVVQQSREKNDEEEVPRELGKAKKSPQQKLLDQAQRQRELKLNSRVGLFDAAEEKKRPIIASAPYRSMADRIEEARARRDTLLMNRVEMELEKRQRETGEIDDRQANESPL